MSGDVQPDKISRLVAEEILRTIYGDDFAGCTVSLEQIAIIIHDAMIQRVSQEEKMAELYETVVSSLHQLSTPPEPSKVTDPNQLRTLLGERLDAIHAITGRTMATTARVKAERSGSAGDLL